jgi:hypothetical protein
MLEDFTETKDTTEVRFGNFSIVEMREGEVLMEPRGTLLSQIASMNDRMNKQETFNGIFKDFEGIHICPINEKDTVKGKYVVERAQGINLSQVRGERDGSVNEFFNLGVQVKASTLLTYVKMVEFLNSKNISFTDHKGGGVFIQESYEDPKKSEISIINARSLALHETKEDAWRKELKGGFGDVLKSFFTRGIDIEEINELIPRGIKEMLDNIETYPNARTFLDNLNAYIYGEAGDVVDPINSLGMSKFDIDCADVAIRRYNFNMTKKGLMKNLEGK